MKKIGLAVLIAIVAASPALAAKKKAPAAEQTFFERNDEGYRFVHDSMPIYWPSVVKMVVYSPGAAAEPAVHHGKKKRK